MKKKLIYLAGAISADNHFNFLENVALAYDMARRIIKMGHSVYVPHLDHQLFFDSNKDYIPTLKEIFENSFEIMQRCDEIWVLPNSENSKGVALEVQWWRDNNKEDKIIFLGENKNADF